ncbi:hypothetical protein [Streptomyces pratensis]|uniref:hypothetical protein n=1 Tax=Streptomyces pratensis TaxID=1169025 RepID=UPI003019BE69
MEQSIDLNKKPEFAAGTDPAFIPLPGLTPAGAAQKAQAEPEDGAKADTAVAADAAFEAADPETQDAGSDGQPEADATAGEEPEEGAEDGPVFEVSDRRGSIRVARRGIDFRLDDQEALFDWDEIGAVEITPARFGRRFTVTVHLSSRRWFNAEVEAGSRSELKRWPAEMEAVLDVYFEES